MEWQLSVSEWHLKFESEQFKTKKYLWLLITVEWYLKITSSIWYQREKKTEPTVLANDKECRKLCREIFALFKLICCL